MKSILLDLRARPRFQHTCRVSIAIRTALSRYRRQEQAASLWPAGCWFLSPLQAITVTAVAQTLPISSRRFGAAPTRVGNRLPAVARWKGDAALPPAKFFEGLSRGRGNGVSSRSVSSRCQGARGSR